MDNLKINVIDFNLDRIDLFEMVGIGSYSFCYRGKFKKLILIFA